ncbi:glycosyltransferase [Butyrivibrio sp. AE3009]|uniref:glycosyltransferase n=1 Tax=Butyrivibrio sp. AE3009 TaxID=1280666 RepID=UPI0003B52591|nr:glycosyltransferase [Butyrivibrio sp. AE3009]
MQDLITVIIPVYKVENYIDKCMESVLTQSYKNLEILLVDDGSPDRCGVICDEYAKRDDRIRVIHKPNGGLSSARNAALDVMQGKWVVCIDSDDYVHRDYVQKLYDAVIRTGADISVCSNYQEKKDKLSIVDIICDEEIVYNSADALLKLVEDNEIKSYAWGKLYRSELFDGVRYPDGRNYEDIATTYLLFDKASKIVKIPYYLYYYLIRDDSISFNKSKQMWHKGCHASCLGQIERCSYFKEKGYDDLYLKAQARLLPYLFSNITSGYSDDSLADVKATQEYIERNKEEFLSNPYISEKDKKLIFVYLRNETYYKLYSGAKKYISSIFTTGRKIRKQISFILSNKGYELEGGAKKRIVYFELPCFDNLGDHAIAYVAEKILADFCKEHKEYQFFAIDGWTIDRPVSVLKKCLGPDDVFICQGGGNFGSLYKFAQVHRGKVYSGLKDNKIIVMPQTCFFAGNEEGKKALEKDRQMIARCRDITLLARDKKSYEFMRESFDADVRFIHDTVSLYDASQFASEDRKGIVVCIRSDKEGTLVTEQKKSIIEICEKKDDVLVTDTCINRNISTSERQAVLESKWRLWGKSRLVVTDRLHGMIFALITKTPCIVIGNDHFKVHEAYKTFEDSGFLFYLDSLSGLEKAVNDMLGRDYSNCGFDENKIDIPVLKQIIFNI